MKNLYHPGWISDHNQSNLRRKKFFREGGILDDGAYEIYNKIPSPLIGFPNRFIPSLECIPKRLLTRNYSTFYDEKYLLNFLLIFFIK
jgi:hypothetical protein